MIEIDFSSKLSISIKNIEQNTENNLKKIIEILIEIGEIKNNHSAVFLSATLVNKEEIQKINKEYRNKDKPTNVLSFEYTENIDKLNQPIVLGDVIVCYDVAEEESFLNKIKLDDHICRLWVHGILHLIGYDDIEDEDAEKMQELEMLVLKKLNINVKTLIESSISYDK